MYKQALQFRENTLGKEHPHTLTSMNNLALLYHSQGRYGQAEPLFKQTLQVRENTLGKEHPSTITSMNNLAGLYESQGRYGQAEPLFKQALQVSENTLGKEHPHTLAIHLNHIYLAVNMEKKKNAFRMLKQMEGRVFSNSFQELYSTSSGRVRRLYLENISNFQSFVFSFACKYPEPEYARYAADVILRWKHIDTQETALQYRLLHTSNAPDINKLRTKIKDLKKNISREIRLGSHRKTEALIQEHEAAEKALRAKFREFRANMQASYASLDQVLGQLPDKSAIVEFRQYRREDFKAGKFGERRLAAYLLLSDIEAKDQVIFADIGSLENILAALIKGPDKLYLQLFNKFDPHIKNVKKLYIAPDSFLNLISFADLILPDQRFLVQRNQVNRLQSGRDLLPFPSTKPSDMLVAMGGVKYGNAIPDKSEGFRLNKQITKEISLKYLPHSKKEAELITELYKANFKNHTTSLYIGDQAKESVLKSMTKAPRILHLSTHGFYIGDAEQKEWLINEEPLLFSGIALAGAKNNMPDDKGEDGWLYSLEVLGLNLQGTELVSLSACNTGRGTTDYSEGVYSLARAFLTAGAKSVLMTLRSVNDDHAKDFMVKFYEIWLPSMANLAPSDALHKTRLAFINHRNPEYRKPEVWAPYVVTGR